MTFLEICEKILLEARIPLTPTEIWLKSKTRFNKKTKSIRPENTISSRLYTSVLRDCNSPFKRIEEGGQVKYGLKVWDQEDPLEVEKVIPLSFDYKNGKTFHERALHPLLTYHQRYYNNQVYTLTIRHEISRKTEKNSNEWLHPDLVGVRFNFIDWDYSLRDLSMMLGGYNYVELLSYEIKKELNPGNFRMHFFQTVSNSGWANERYLCALYIDPDEEFRQELKTLSCEHGIGIIELNMEPDNSRVLFDAKRNENIQYGTVNKLCNVNPDFCNFIATVYKSANINTVLSGFDPVLEADVLHYQLKQLMENGEEQSAIAEDIKLESRI